MPPSPSRKVLADGDKNRLSAPRYDANDSVKNSPPKPSAPATCHAFTTAAPTTGPVGSSIERPFFLGPPLRHHSSVSPASTPSETSPSPVRRAPEDNRLRLGPMPLLVVPRKRSSEEAFREQQSRSSTPYSAEGIRPWGAQSPKGGSRNDGFPGVQAFTRTAQPQPSKDSRHTINFLLDGETASPPRTILGSKAQTGQHVSPPAPSDRRITLDVPQAGAPSTDPMFMWATPTPKQVGTPSSSRCPSPTSSSQQAPHQLVQQHRHQRQLPPPPPPPPPPAAPAAPPQLPPHGAPQLSLPPIPPTTLAYYHSAQVLASQQISGFYPEAAAAAATAAAAAAAAADARYQIAKRAKTYPEVPALLDVHRPEFRLEGEPEDVKVFDTCDTVREKIRAMLGNQGITQAAFLRELGKVYDPPRRLQSKSLNDFLIKCGPRAGNTSCIYYSAYVFFEKMRIRDGEDKTPQRLSMESIWPQGCNTTEVRNRVYVKVGESVWEDEYGRIRHDARP